LKEAYTSENIRKHLQFDIFKSNDLETPTTEDIKAIHQTNNKKFLPIEAFDPMVGSEDGDKIL
jgi:hypothetical protein